jgi:RNA polymerase sigma-70 factor, ECF subfamily
MVLRLDMIRMFQQLTPQQRQMMWLAYVEGADHREIAAALGLREGSVRVLLHRARRRLASLIQVVSRPGSTDG